MATNTTHTRPKGCYECSRRRIICDKTEPKCLKCQRKGIQCSGQGLRIRFSSGLASRGKLKDRQVPLIEPPSEASSASTEAGEAGCRDAGGARKSKMALKWVNDAHISGKRGRRRRSERDCRQSPGLSTSTTSSPLDNRSVSAGTSIECDKPLTPVAVRRESLGASAKNGDGRTHVWSAPSLYKTIDILDPKTRLLFRHFSEAVAPVMVVWDGEFNGYRNIILPLAFQDEVLTRVISVVAAHHLAAQMPELQRPALAGQMAIVSKLRRDSFQLESAELFSPTTWATVLLLLVGETITGGNDFIYLLEILMFVAEASAHRPDLPPEVHQFLMQQTKMFQLFGFPLSHEFKGVKTLEKKTDHYLDFMFYPPTPSDSKAYTNTTLMRDAIRDACAIYRRRAGSSLAEEESTSLLEDLRQKVIHIDHLTEGSHALVWTYFIAAAESSSLEHREFFTERLRNLYGRTKFRSIPAALGSLDKLWSTQGHHRWTESVGHESTVLVM